MKKRHKIRRYNKIYKNRRINISFTPIQIIVFLAVVIVLFCVGWVVASTITERLLNPRSEEEILSEIEGNSGEDEQGKQNENNNVNEQNENEKATQDIYKIIDVSTIQSDTLLKQFIEDAKALNVNKILFNAKNSDGVLLYSSKNVTAISSSAIGANIDILKLSNTLKENKMELVVSVSAFKDHKVPLKFIESSVKYKNTKYRWLDNSAEKGGKPWLDPSSVFSQKYITEIIDELYSLGVNNIIVNDFCYPYNVKGLDLATFVSGNDPLSKKNTLATFMEQLQQNAKTKNKNISFNILLNELMTPSGIPYGEGTILPKNAVVDFSQNLGNYNILVNNTPTLLDANTLNTDEGKINYFTNLIEELKKKLPPDTNIVIIMLKNDHNLIKDKIKNITYIIK